LLVSFSVFISNMSLLAIGRSFSRRIVASAAPSASLRGFASVGDQLPSVELHLGFPPEKHNLADFAKDKSILLVGLPGAFTPTWYAILIRNIHISTERDFHKDLLSVMHGFEAHPHLLTHSLVIS
jgi:hypothetical protein